MPIVLNGDGTVTGITAGGLPNGCITADDLASGVGGKVLQYKQYQAVGSYSTTSTSWTSISSDFEFDLQNVQTNSNVLISFCAPKGSTTNDVVRFKIVRVKGGVSTDLGLNTTGDGAGRTSTMSNYIGGDSSNQIFHVAFQWWDMDPAGDGNTTITYKIQWIANSGQTCYLGQSDPASFQQRAGGTQAYVVEYAA